jgi:tRNA(adenine34) deaminase
MRHPMSPTTPDHEGFMRRCLKVAAIACNEGNTPVGSVVVLGGEIIGEAGEALPAGTSVTGHAEVLACQAALDRTGRRDLAGASLYTTAEPCFLCSFVIRQLRLALVVHGVETPRSAASPRDNRS